MTDFIAANWLFISFFVLVIIIYIGFELSQARALAYTLSPSEATKVVNREKGVFVDIRPEAHYNDKHIVASIHMPIETLQKKPQRLNKYKQKPIILYCKNGASSKVARMLLMRQGGFEKVYILQGGMGQWLKDKMPTETNQPQQETTNQELEQND